MQIRRAIPKDIPDLDRLLGQVLEIHANLRPDIFLPGTRKYTEDQLKEILADAERPVFVAEDDQGRVQGYCFCAFQERKGCPNMKDARILYIDDLCVDAAARGQQIGKKLYLYVRDFARKEGCQSLTLHVWEGNDSARRFYEKMGMGVQKTLMEQSL